MTYEMPPKDFLEMSQGGKINVVTTPIENALWYVTDDRFTYKPGEKVYVKGWIRWTTNGVNPDLALPSPAETAECRHGGFRRILASRFLVISCVMGGRRCAGGSATDVDPEGE
jgi:hypothetical protein